MLSFNQIGMGAVARSAQRMAGQVEWIDDRSDWLGQTITEFADCNIAAPSEAGKQIIKRLQAMLQREVPGSGVLQTGFLDAATCGAWQVWRDTKAPWIPVGDRGFNINNILDTLYGRGNWKCNGPMIVPSCSQVGPGPTDVECPQGFVRDADDVCVPEITTCLPGQRLDPLTNSCVEIVCAEGEVFDPTTNQCVKAEPTSTKRRKSNTGLLLLASAAAAAIAIATI